jgi:transposase InsO family protein
MSRKVVTVERKLAALFADVSSGRSSVVDVCADLGISRDTYYRYKKRFAEEGLAGLQPRSRAPKTSPTKTDEQMTALIVAARKTLEREGWDNGALSIESRLFYDGVDEVPCARTIHRVLTREGLVEANPKKRPRSSYKRFVFPATDDCWQIDAFEFVLADPAATTVVVFAILDDHSRYDVADLAWPAEMTEGAWRAMTHAIDRYGKPRMVLCDNGLAFTGRRVGTWVLFEKNLAHLGIKMINSRPLHPQTNGKNERSHRTTRKWLAAQPQPTTLAELQDLLDQYRPLYNNHRPHQGIDRTTPLQRRIAGIRPTPPTQQPIPLTDIITARASTRDGYISVQGTIVPLGTEYAELTLTVFVTGDHALVFYREQLVRELIIDRTHKRQPPMRPRTGNTPRRGTLTYTPQP